MSGYNFRLALCGEPCAEQAKSIESVINAILKEQVNLKLTVGSSYTGSGWAEIGVLKDRDVFAVLKDGDTVPVGEHIETLYISTAMRSAIGETICNSADMVLAVWNEDVAQRSGAVWELIELSRRRGAPCVWISSKTGEIYRVGRSSFENYEPDKLADLVSAHKVSPLEPIPDVEAKIPLLGLGKFLRKSYLNRYKANKSETSPNEDRILTDDFSIESEGVGYEPLRKKLLDRFKAFDSAAIALNVQYQAVIYWRAVLPFIANIFLAIGFYTETLLGILSIPVGILSVVAGIGFLIHGLLNLYVFFLSRNKGIRDKQKAFIENRYVAEILRVIIHFLPYGVSADLRALCGGDESVRAAILDAASDSCPKEQKLDEKSGRVALEHVDEMLRDQIDYHKASAERYGRIVAKLDKWNKVIFAAGFVTVILRALLQFYVSLFPLNGLINGVELNSYVTSFANMAAMLLPAWASYFASKINLCNFRYNLDNHTRTAERLSEVLEQVRGLEGRKDLPVDVMGTVAEDVSRSMILEDTMAWEHKLGGASVTLL